LAGKLRKTPVLLIYIAMDRKPSNFDNQYGTGLKGKTMDNLQSNGNCLITGETLVK